VGGSLDEERRKAVEKTGEVIELRPAFTDPLGVVDAVHVTQDGWAELPGKRYVIHGELRDYWELPDSFTGHGFDGAFEAELRGGLLTVEIQRGVVQGFKRYRRRYRTNDGEWVDDGTFVKLTEAKKEFRQKYGQMTRLIYELRTKQHIAELGINEKEYTRRGDAARERYGEFLQEHPAARNGRDLWKLKRNALKLARLDNKSIKEDRERALRDAGLDDDSLNERQEAVLCEYGLDWEAQDRRPEPEEGSALGAWRKRTRELRKRFGSLRVGEGRAADVAAAQEFPELWKD
jgi:hypothetical protein